MRRFALLLLVAFVGIAAIAVVGAPSAQDEPEPTYIVVESSYRGRMASEWARIAIRASRRSSARLRLLRRQRRALRQLVHAAPHGNHWLDSAFLCIHAFEGRWNDPGAPHWGGLQMDSAFQHSYGREFLRYFGTADRWPTSVQIAVAIRAYIAGRGFLPWPNTARLCGLL